MKVSACILLILGCCVLIAQEILAQNFVEITAEIDLISYQSSEVGGGTQEQRRLYSLECTVGENEWSISSDFLLNGKENWHFDGTNVYRAVQITKDLLKDLPRGPDLPAPVPFGRAKSNLVVSIWPAPGGHPFGNLGVNIPWLAFCSGSYLHSPGRLVPLPTCDARSAPDALGYKDEIDFFSHAFGLPRRVRLFISSDKLIPKDPRLSRIPDAVAARSEFAADSSMGGLLKFDYQVLESTNIHNRIFPTTFKYTTYQPTSSGDLRPLVGGVGRVLRIGSGTKPRGVFQPEKNQTIVDYRFRSETRPVDGIAYRATNINSPPLTNSAVLQSKLSERLKLASSLRSPSIEARSLATIICLIVITALFLVGMLRVWAKTKGKA